jgi:hypothetical protein
MKLSREHPLSPRRLAVQARQAHALTLRRRGQSWTEIAIALRRAAEQGAGSVPPKYDASHARKDVLAAIERWTVGVRDEAEVERCLWLERLDEMFSSIYPAAKRGDLPAIDRVLALMGLTAKLIPGVYPKPSGGDVSAERHQDNGCTTAHLDDTRQVVVNVEWPDVPEPDVAGFADPADPATAIEITKLLIGTLGRPRGEQMAASVREQLAAMIAH